MFHKIKMLFCCFIMILFGMGCITMQGSSKPEDCKDSVIYTKVKNPEIIGSLIQIANLKAIQEHLYKKQAAIETVNIMKQLLSDDTITFDVFLDSLKPIIGKHIADYGSEVLLLRVALTNLHIKTKIPECDRDLLIGLCDKLLLQLQ